MEATGYITRSTNTVNIGISNEKDRLLKFARRKQMLNDDFYSLVEQELGNVITSANETGLIDQIDDTNNIFRMVMEEISRVYDNDPIREFSLDDNIQKEMENLYDDIQITEILEQSNLYINSFNDVILQVGYNKEEEKITLRLRTPDNTIVKTNNNLELEEVYIYGGKITIDKKDCESWYGYTADEIFMLQVNNANEVLSHDYSERLPLNGAELNNPLGFLPFIPIHKGFRDDYFWQCYKGDDLVKANLQIAIKLTILNQLIKFQSFKQIVATADGGNDKALDGITLDPASVIYLFGENSKIETLDLESNYKQLWDTVKEITQNIATNYKVSPNMFRMTSTPSSGFALMMENSKLDKSVQKQQNNYSRIEVKLFNMMKDFDTKMNLNIIKGDDFKISFSRPAYPKSDIEVLEEQQKKVEMGKDNIPAILVKEKGITDEEAKKVYAENLDIRNKMYKKVDSGTIDESETRKKLGL